jgi:hypothetical protein
LTPGTYRLLAYAHSTVTGSFPAARFADVTVVSTARLTVDAPANGASVAQGFTIGGWALDFGAASGNGIDVVHVYAAPLDWAGAAIFLGQAPVNGSRPDLAAAFGRQFGSSGFNLAVPTLQPGRYRLVLFAHSVVAGAFTAAVTVDVSVR